MPASGYEAIYRTHSLIQPSASTSISSTYPAPHQHLTATQPHQSTSSTAPATTAPQPTSTPMTAYTVVSLTCSSPLSQTLLASGTGGCIHRRSPRLSRKSCRSGRWPTIIRFSTVIARWSRWEGLLGVCWVFWMVLVQVSQVLLSIWTLGLQHLLTATILYPMPPSPYHYSPPMTSPQPQQGLAVRFKPTSASVYLSLPYLALLLRSALLISAMNSSFQYLPIRSCFPDVIPEVIPPRPPPPHSPPPSQSRRSTSAAKVRCDVMKIVVRMILVRIILWGWGFGRWLLMPRGLGLAGVRFTAGGQNWVKGFIVMIMLMISMRTATIRCLTLSPPMINLPYHLITLPYLDFLPTLSLSSCLHFYDPYPLLLSSYPTFPYSVPAPYCPHCSPHFPKLPSNPHWSHSPRSFPPCFNFIHPHLPIQPPLTPRVMAWWLRT